MERPVTARRAQELALERYRVQAGKNASAAKDASKRKQTTYEVLDELLNRHPIPPSPFGGKLKSQSKRQTRFRTWVDGFHREIVAGNPSDEFKRRVGAVLEQKLLGRGYPREKRLDGRDEPIRFAASTAQFIMEADAGSSLEDWLLGERPSDMTGSQSGPRSAEGGER